jgi:saccharopine dehydrogenase (NAD+, L-lysine-forming)
MPANAGANYQDLAFGPSIETSDLGMLGAFKKELDLDHDYKDQGTTALVNTGMDPGISDLMVGYAADNLSHLYEARIKDVAVLKSRTPVSTWSPNLLWVDMLDKPCIYTNGTYKRVEPFSDEETYVFPEPIGSQPCYMHAHEEVYTLPLFLKDLRYVDFKMGGPDMPFAKAIWEYGLAEDKPINVKGREVVPLDVFLALTPPALTPDEIEVKIKDGTLIDEIACLTLDCKGERNGREVSSTYYTILSLKGVNERIRGVTATSYYVGMGAVAIAELLLEGKITTTGVSPPEAYNSAERKEAIKRLGEKGIEIHRIEHTRI